MGDVSKLIGYLEKVLGVHFDPSKLPHALVMMVATVVVVAIILAGVCWVVARLADLKKKLQELLPRFSTDERRRSRQRRRFAQHVQIELQRGWITWRVGRTSALRSWKRRWRPRANARACWRG